MKFEFLEGRLSGQVSLFDITKENDMLSTLGTPQLERLYPVADYPLLYDDLDGTGFSPSGRKVAGIDTQSRGVELDLYYNPSKELSLFLGYAYSDAETFTNSPVIEEDVNSNQQKILENIKQQDENLTSELNDNEILESKKKSIVIEAPTSKPVKSVHKQEISVMKDHNKNN